MMPGIPPTKTYYTTNIDQINIEKRNIPEQPLFSLNTAISLEHLSIFTKKEDGSLSSKKSEHKDYQALINDLSQQIPSEQRPQNTAKLEKLCEWAHVNLNNDDFKAEVARHLGCSVADLTYSSALKQGSPEWQYSPTMHIHFEDNLGHSISVRVRQNSSTEQPTALMWKVVGTEDKRSLYRWIVDLLHSVLHLCPLDKDCKINFETMMYPQSLLDIHCTPEERLSLHTAIDATVGTILNKANGDPQKITDILEQHSSHMCTQHINDEIAKIKRDKKLPNQVNDLKTENDENNAISHQRGMIAGNYAIAFRTANSEHDTILNCDTPTSNLKTTLRTEFIALNISTGQEQEENPMLTKLGEIIYDRLRDRLPPDQQVSNNGKTGKLPLSAAEIKTILKEVDTKVLALAKKKSNTPRSDFQ